MSVVHEMVVINVVVLWLAVVATALVMLRRRNSASRTPMHVATPAHAEHTLGRARNAR